MRCLDSVPCNFSTVVSFVFGLKEFPVAPNIFNIGSVDSNDPNICLGGLMYDPTAAAGESKNELCT